MRTGKTLFLLFLSILFSVSVNGQELLTPRRIKAKGVYFHGQTLTAFPLNFDSYQRTGIYSFDKKESNISVVYEDKQNQTTFSIYIYPAGDGYEGRLRKEYLKSVLSIAGLSEAGIHVTRYAVRHEGEKYICNGFKSILEEEENMYNSLTLFECGQWFLKVRITSSGLDSSMIAVLEQKIYSQYDPTLFTEASPLDPKADLFFSSAAFRDSLLLGSAMESAYKKIEWALANVGENERASGFPDLYLNMHVESLKAFLEFQHRFNYKKSEFTTRYLNELQLIADAGFLNEFVIDQYNAVLIIPENTPDKNEAYNAWKLDNNITIDLNQLFYVVSYGQKKE